MGRGYCPGQQPWEPVPSGKAWSASLPPLSDPHDQEALGCCSRSRSGRSLQDRHWGHSCHSVSSWSLSGRTAWSSRELQVDCHRVPGAGGQGKRGLGAHISEDRGLGPVGKGRSLWKCSPGGGHVRTPALCPQLPHNPEGDTVMSAPERARTAATQVCRWVVSTLRGCTGACGGDRTCTPPHTHSPEPPS